MTPDRLADVATAGAAGVAAIGLFASANRSLADVVADARTAWARGYTV